jgi:hypothetical protein
MHHVEVFDSLQLKEDLAADYQIDAVHIDLVATIEHWKMFFAFAWDVARLEFGSHGAVIDSLEQPRTQFPMDDNAAADRFSTKLLDFGIER